MNQELQLKVQAFLDDELEAKEAREMADLIARDPAAAALCAELKQVSQLVKANELLVKCPDTREFHWCQIERGIIRESRAGSTARSGGHSWWVRYFAPAFGAVLLFVGGLSLLRLGGPSGQLSYLSEIE